MGRMEDEFFRKAAEADKARAEEAQRAAMAAREAIKAKEDAEASAARAESAKREIAERAITEAKRQQQLWNDAEANKNRPPIQPVQMVQRPNWGPPNSCRHCGGALWRTTEATSEGSGCIIFILGLLLAPLCIGIFIMIYGLNLMMKRKGLYECRRCGAEFPRTVSWFEFG